MKHIIDMKINRTVAMTLTILMLCATVSQGLSENMTPKEEVVYGNLAQGGMVKELYVVNAFELLKESTITDYGDYSALRNMSTTEKLTDQNGTVNIKAPKGKFYYQGNLKSKELPWAIKIDYSLNGTLTPPDKLASKAGKLVINISIKQNKSVDPSFFENFALQISLKLDVEKSTDIIAKGATIASSGGDKVVTYILMPGKEKQISLSSNVKNFSMEGIQFNGIPLALLIEAPDTTDMADGFIELKDGVIKLSDGTKKLLDGSVELSDGAFKLKDGAETLKEGVQKLLDGLKDLTDGAVDLNQGVIDLKDGVDELADGSTDMRSGLRKLKDQSEPLSDGITEAGDGIGSLASGMRTLSESSAEAASGTSEFVTGSAIFRQGLGGLEVGSAALASGLEGLEGSLSAIDSEAENAAKTLSTSTDPAIQALIEGYLIKNIEVENSKTLLSQLTPAASEVASTAKSLSDGYILFDQGLSQLLQGLIRQQEAINLLSGGLTNLDSQFVILSDGIRQYTSGVSDAYLGYIDLHEGILALQDGTTELADGYSKLADGSKELIDGTQELYDGTSDLSDGTKTLYDGTKDLEKGVSDMQDGSSEMKDKTATIDSDVQKEIDKMMDDYQNEDFVPKSFVSPNNTSVLAVQFVLQTEKIEVPDVSDSTLESVMQRTLWQRIVIIFGMIGAFLQNLFS